MITIEFTPFEANNIAQITTTATEREAGQDRLHATPNTTHSKRIPSSSDHQCGYKKCQTVARRNL